MDVAAFTVACVALAVGLLALSAALDARDFWRTLLEDFRSNDQTRARIDRQPWPFWERR